MRIVIGIDPAGCWKTGADLLSRLRFQDGVVDVMHFDEPPVYYLGDLDVEAVSHLITGESTEASAAEGQRIVDEASALLRGKGVTTDVSATALGSAAQGLMQYADRVKAALIVVGNSKKSQIASFFTGSVGRGLVIGAHQSVLIARDKTAGGGPVRAVFATDHSPYATACINTLLMLVPQGVSHLTILTVYPKLAVEVVRPLLPEFAPDASGWIERSLEARNQEALLKLAPLRCTFDSQVIVGDVHEAIRDVVQKTRADLLILGAQGHGFVERVTLGSVSFHQALAEPHSVLVLRT